MILCLREKNIKNKFIVILLGIFLLFVLVDISHSKLTDGYDLKWFGEDDKIVVQRNAFMVHFIWYDDQLDLNTSYEAFNGVELTGGSKIRGFAVVNPNSEYCFLHVMKPEIWDDREAMIIIGHELMHCTLADHAGYESVPLTSETIESLYSQDRKLELEWLKSEYEELGIKID